MKRKLNTFDMKKSTFFSLTVLFVSAIDQSYSATTVKFPIKFLEVQQRKQGHHLKEKSSDDYLEKVIKNPDVTNSKMEGDRENVYPGQHGYFPTEESEPLRSKPSIHLMNDPAKNSEHWERFSFSTTNYARKLKAKNELSSRPVIQYNSTSNSVGENSPKDPKSTDKRGPRNVDAIENSMKIDRVSGFLSPAIGYQTESKKNNETSSSPKELFNIALLYDERNNSIACPIEVIETEVNHSHLYQLLDDTQLLFMRAGKEKVMLRDRKNRFVEWDLHLSGFYELLWKSEIVYLTDERNNPVLCRSVYKKIGSNIEQLFELSDGAQLRFMKAGRNKVTLRHEDGRFFEWNLRRISRGGVNEIRRGLPNSSGFILLSDAIGQNKV